jgi:hypothetical protein
MQGGKVVPKPTKISALFGFKEAISKYSNKFLDKNTTA